ncbi:hypothetical protein BaRGS_00002499 [Batillaria attramentaria]|uniref:Uncharacterized protein n=1 Tax=Batillaria attramentaria TaxID=370345 RepID=A0ABD0M3V9_9CAEN
MRRQHRASPMIITLEAASEFQTGCRRQRWREIVLPTKQEMSPPSANCEDTPAITFDPLASAPAPPGLVPCLPLPGPVISRFLAAPLPGFLSDPTVLPCATPPSPISRCRHGLRHVQHNTRPPTQFAPSNLKGH